MHKGLWTLLSHVSLAYWEVNRAWFTSSDTSAATFIPAHYHSKALCVYTVMQKSRHADLGNTSWAPMLLCASQPSSVFAAWWLGSIPKPQAGYIQEEWLPQHPVRWKWQSTYNTEHRLNPTCRWWYHPPKLPFFPLGSVFVSFFFQKAFQLLLVGRETKKTESFHLNTSI